MSLKVFLTALAIIDDLGSIVIIALFYSGDLSIKYLTLMLLAFIILLLINKFNIKKFLPYLVVGLFLWDFTHNSGIHATIAGVLLAMTIPHRKKEKDFSLLIKIEHAISPYVAFGIMPLFAFANAGVSLEGLSFASLLDKVPLGPSPKIVTFAFAATNPLRGLYTEVFLIFLSTFNGCLSNNC